MKMKKIVYFLSISLLLFSCNDSSVDIEGAKIEAKAAIAGQFDFWASGSLEQAKSTFSSDAVLIGTDEAEYLTGWDEIEPSIKGQLAIEDPKFVTRDLNMVMSSGGDMASYTQLVDFTFSVGGEAGEIKNVRNSGVVKKTDGQWKVVQIHWSVGVQGQAVEYEY